MDIDSKEMALLSKIRVLLLRIGCVGIGLTDLSVMIAIYLSPLARNHIYPVIAVILTAPTVLLIFGAIFRIRLLDYPWMKINWIIAFIFPFIIFLIGIVVFELKYNVSVADVAGAFLLEPDQFHNPEVLLYNEQPLEKKKVKMILIYLIGTFTLFSVVLLRMAVVKAFSKTLYNKEIRQQAQVDLPNAPAEQPKFEVIVQK